MNASLEDITRIKEEIEQAVILLGLKKVLAELLKTSKIIDDKTAGQVSTMVE